MAEQQSMPRANLAGPSTSSPGTGGMPRSKSRDDLINAATPKVVHGQDPPSNLLRRGLNCFIFIDAAGRTVPVWYHMPKSFKRTSADGEQCSDDDDDDDDDDDVLDDGDSDDEGETEIVDTTTVMELDDAADESGSQSINETQGEGSGWQPELIRGEEDNQVIFVCHGVLRNADAYCRVWRKFSVLHNFLLICPEFNLQNFPEVRNYQLGNMVTKTGKPIPPAKWSFNVIEDIFMTLRRADVQRAAYSIYGHSAGAQFVHRLVQFLPNCHVNTAISANPGWYTMPDLLAAFPYGWRGLEIDDPIAQMTKAMSRSLVVLLGQEDNKTKHLRTTPHAMVQGSTRLDRGFKFFQTARHCADHIQGLVLAWSLNTVPGVGHSDKGMAGYAVRELVSSTRIAHEAHKGTTLQMAKFDVGMVANPPTCLSVNDSKAPLPEDAVVAEISLS